MIEISGWSVYPGAIIFTFLWYVFFSSSSTPETLEFPMINKVDFQQLFKMILRNWEKTMNCSSSSTNFYPNSKVYLAKKEVNRKYTNISHKFSEIQRKLPTMWEIHCSFIPFWFLAISDYSMSNFCGFHNCEEITSI